MGRPLGSPVCFNYTVPTGTATVGAPAGALEWRTVTLACPASNSDIVYVGPIGVTVLTGFPIEPGKSVTFKARENTSIYSISGTASQKLRALYK